MNTKRILLLISLWTLGFPCLTRAQIRENDASVSVLAVQCAVSSGFSAIEYEDYCRSLAKTLSLLSSAQQTRVFGYLPMASGSGIDSGEKDAAPTGSPHGESETSKNEGPDVKSGGNNTEAAGPDDNASDVAESNFLMNLVKRINAAIDGTGTELAPIIAP